MVTTATTPVDPGYGRLQSAVATAPARILMAIASVVEVGEATADR